MDYFIIGLVVFLAGMLVLGGLAISFLVAPHHPGKIKNEPYECGEKTIGPSWIQFNVGYYIFGLLFLVFDVEAAFLFPWAVVLREVGMVGFIEAGLFVLILGVGLLYAWKKGGLEWV